MKPIYKIAIVVGVIIIIGLLVYFFWQRTTSTPPPPKEESKSEATLPISGEKESPKKGQEESFLPESTGETPELTKKLTVKKLSEYKVFDIFSKKEGQEIYYIAEDGKIWAAKSGPDLEISKQTINALNFIETNPNGEKIIAAFGDPQKPQWGIFDLVDKVWRPLPDNIVYASWGDNDSTLIAVVKNGNEKNLVNIDLRKSPPAYTTIIKNFNLHDIRFHFIPPQTLIIRELSSAFYPARIWKLDLKNLSFNLLLAPTPGLEIKWNTPGSLAFLSDTKHFQIIDETTFEAEEPVPFFTFPQKCAFTLNVIYCFVPQSLPQNAVLPDDYFQKNFYTIDNLYSIDPQSGESEVILSSGTEDNPPLDAKNPIYLNGSLYFINRYDNALYELKFLNLD
jgi:hypothetical protein